MSEKPDLITLTDPRSPAAEAYRTLRTNLTFAGLDKPIESLIVTSAAPGDEKSTTLANLAVAMAQGERRTILVDADLRRPQLHEIFNIANEPGLTALFVDPETLADPPLVETGVENLTLLPSGALPPNPADLLGSHRMEEIIAALRAQADILLFDAPPVIAVSDAAVLGTKVDGVLLVVGAGKTRRDHAQQAREQLERVRARIVGAVLTSAPRDVSLGGYYAAGR
jgi:non-specific protein-tyrosine kinase